MWDGETEAHGLTRLMIGVLAENYHLDAIEGSAVEGGENLITRRITSVLRPLGNEEGLQFGEIGGIELGLKDREP